VRSILFVATFGILGGTLLFEPLAAGPQIEILPGSAVRGQALFTEKNCVACHSINGEGGTSAPDLASRSVREYSPELLASVMWNHGPAMWDRAGQSDMPMPAMSSLEASDLFAYFYAELYFTLPGDAARGRGVFVEENCATCHALSADDATARPGPPVSGWARVGDPIAWVERMWNHANGMYAEMEQRSIPWPTLTEQQIVDLLVFLRNDPQTNSVRAEFNPGNAAAGLPIFTRNCEGCHAFGDPLPGQVDLLRGSAPRTFTGWAAEMWNHAPRMQARAESEGQETLPRIEDGAMNDLVAYLFTERAFSAPGDPRAGAQVFAGKQCRTCHEQEQASSGAPDLTRVSEYFSPITMTRAMWNHGPAMRDALEARGLEWPEFEGSQMADLIAYLNTRVVPSVANDQ
jgi:mono/diheme cytochrome c family protein